MAKCFSPQLLLILEAIIYCHKRQDCEVVSHKLKEAGIPCVGRNCFIN